MGVGAVSAVSELSSASADTSIVRLGWLHLEGDLGER